MREAAYGRPFSLKLIGRVSQIQTSRIFTGTLYLWNIGQPHVVVCSKPEPLRWGRVKSIASSRISLRSARALRRQLPFTSPTNSLSSYLAIGLSEIAAWSGEKTGGSASLSIRMPAGVASPAMKQQYWLNTQPHLRRCEIRKKVLDIRRLKPATIIGENSV